MAGPEDVRVPVWPMVLAVVVVMLVLLAGWWL
jgi:hypothetical protein